MSVNLLAGIIFIVSGAVSWYLIGKVREIVVYKKILADPDHRSSHLIKTPVLGGIAFYLVLMLGLFFIMPYDEQQFTRNLIPALTIMFFTGLKDDLVVISPYTKLLAQVAATLFLVVNPEINPKFFGVFGFTEVPYVITFVATVLVVVTIINTINLLDGIDGLAAIIAINIFATFGLIFYMLNNHFFCLLSVMCIALLLAYLRYNFSEKNKIFMGDTGSLIIGLLVGLFTVKFLSLKRVDLLNMPFDIDKAPLIAVLVLMVPLFDTLRVFTIRLLNKKSPFEADRKHIHHLIIDYYEISHKKASFVIGAVHLGLIIAFIILSFYVESWLLVLIFFIKILGITLYFYFIYRPEILRLLRLKKNKYINKNIPKNIKRV